MNLVIFIHKSSYNLLPSHHQVLEVYLGVRVCGGDGITHPKNKIFHS